MVAAANRFLSKLFITMRFFRELDPTNYLFQRRKFYVPNRFSPLLEIARVLLRFDSMP